MDRVDRVALGSFSGCLRTSPDATVHRIVHHAALAQGLPIENCVLTPVAGPAYSACGAARVVRNDAPSYDSEGTRVLALTSLVLVLVARGRRKRQGLRASLHGAGAQLGKIGGRLLLRVGVSRILLYLV